MSRRQTFNRLQGFYDIELTDTADCAGPLLDLVDANAITIPDALTGAPQGSVYTGKNWNGKSSARVSAAFKIIHKFIKREQVTNAL